MGEQFMPDFPESFRHILTDIFIPHHIKHCNQIFTVMKYGVNRVTLAGSLCGQLSAGNQLLG